MSKQKYWYKYFIGECPFCGNDRSYKERIYSEKPKDREDRIERLSYQETFCCWSEFCY